MSEGSRWTAGQRVSATSSPKVPPMARNTTAATALALISRCAARSTCRPVAGQVRNLAASAPRAAFAGVTTVAMSASLTGFDDVDAAGHHVVAEAAILVADDTE